MRLHGKLRTPGISPLLEEITILKGLSEHNDTSISNDVNSELRQKASREMISYFLMIVSVITPCKAMTLFWLLFGSGRHL